MRRALLALAFLLAPSCALACSLEPGFTFRKAFDDASLVFRGLVTETKLNPYVPSHSPSDLEGFPDAKGRSLLDIRYEILETFKGEPEADGIISTSTMIMGGCGLPVIPGWQFLFVVAPFEASKMPASNSQGFVWSYSSNMLPAFPPQLQKSLEEVRRLSGKK